VKILATADVHSPRFIEGFRESLQTVHRPDMFLLAGDMISRGQVEEYLNVLDSIEAAFGKGLPIIACFGNEEYSEVRKQLVSLVGDRMVFLDEKSMTLEVNEITIGIVGTQGSLDKATSWQKRNIPSWRGVFERRARRASSLLRKFRGQVDKTILLMHYSPCLETCEGENERAFSWLGSRKFYRVVMEQQPDLVIHGHVHNSTRHSAQLGPTLIHNVAFPAVGHITEIDLSAL
jgi:Icc-related predicted phosphoesterase